MTRDEWIAVLAMAPCTPNQVGALHKEANRLGLTDRAERLAACAALLGLDDLETTKDLTQGQAGYLVRALSDAADRADLPAMSPAGPAMTLAQATRAVLVQLYAPCGHQAAPITPEVRT